VEHVEGEYGPVRREGVVHLVRGLVDFEAGVGIKWGGGEGVPALDCLGVGVTPRLCLCTDQQTDLRSGGYRLFPHQDSIGRTQPSSYGGFL